MDLFHYGVKGQKWGVRRFQNKDGTLTAEGRAHCKMLRETHHKRRANSEVMKAIEAGKISVKVNVSNQTKHIQGSHNFEIGKSYILGNLKDCQTLISELYGTGQALIKRRGEFNNKERVRASREFGVYVNEETKQESKTRYGIIHYGKAGAHIIPARSKE